MNDKDADLCFALLLLGIVLVEWARERRRVAKLVTDVKGRIEDYAA